ncbi:Aste57867_21655 [Aphanomyces stellatus]|uniref:Aste57867_21655 protein n=1 Tax=Aphanomyces stellatus TaxID=120398 RepID=A0A485LIR2_9STRA|nr:hypothetical protein As57867_021586 [Aphanomyces stellatus]VFT98324.1 Aste57867_21655 [Aphanomyces stellatus]
MATASSSAFSLHKAIWDGNLAQVDDILQHAEWDPDPKNKELPILQERDPRGNTPLMLALRCVTPSQLEIVRLLIKYGANVHTRDCLGWSCIQNATLCDSDDIMTEIFLRAEKQTYEMLRARSILLYSILHDIPDFYVEIKIELTSWVPLVSRALPSDTLKIWKKGSNIRCDFTIKDLHNTTWKRGRLSHLLRTFPTQSGQVVLLDHDAKSAKDMSKFMANPSKEDIENGLEMLYTCKMSTYNADIAKMTLKPKKDVFKKKVAGQVGQKYEMLHANVKLRLRGAAQPHWTPDGIAAAPTATSLTKAKKFLAHLTPTKKASPSIGSTHSSPQNSLVVTGDAPAEMHLQVQPGDCLHWQFTSSVEGVTCKAVLCANNTVAEITHNPYAIDDHGLVILTWTNPHPKKKAVVTHQIVHQRHVAASTRSRTNSSLDRTTQSSSSSASDLSPTSRRASTATDGMASPPTPPMPMRMANPRVQATAFHEYFESDPELHQSFRGLTVGPDERTFSKELKGTVTMSEAFPFQVEDFLPVAQFLSSRAEQFDTLRAFFEMKLPPGFPVKFQIPMMLSVRASYTFLNAGPCTVDDAHFAVPSGYTN